MKTLAAKDGGVEANAEVATHDGGVEKGPLDRGPRARSERHVRVEKQEHVAGRTCGADPELVAATLRRGHDDRPRKGGVLGGSVGAFRVGDDDLIGK